MATQPPLSAKQQAALDTFRELISDVRHPEHGDLDLLKWLRAKGFNAKKAEDMYRKSMKWRKEMDADHLVGRYEEPEVLRRYYGGGVCGTDTEGCPIQVDPVGKIDVKGIVRSSSKADITRMVVARIEQAISLLRDLSNERGHRVHQVVQIVDMAGLDPSQMGMAGVHFYLGMMRIVDNHYPGLVKRSYIINAPSIFAMAWRFMKRFLSAEITEKFLILYGDGMEALLADLPANQIPACYGGTQTDDDGDPSCRNKINYGGVVPESFYLTAEKCLPASGTVTTQVGRGDSLLVDLPVRRLPCTIRWVFVTEGNSIKFGVYRKRIPEERHLEAMEEIQPLAEVESHLIPEQGSLMCCEEGEYVLAFDNRGSRLTRRKLTYFTSTDIHDEDSTSWL